MQLHIGVVMQLREVHFGTVVRLESGRVVVAAIGPGSGMQYVVQESGAVLATRSSQKVEVLGLPWLPHLAVLLIKSCKVKESTMYTTTVEKLINEMRESGYLLGAPDEEIDILDTEIIGRLCCKLCGGTLTYLPFHKVFGSYRPFTICDECGDTREF